MGVNSVAELLRDCGYKVVMADSEIAQALNNFRYEKCRKIVLDWLRSIGINRIGLSYRLDRDEALNMVGYFINELKNNGMMHYQGGPIKAVYFGGLPETCDIIEKEYKGFVITFKGGESAAETLQKMGVPRERISRDITEGSLYDDRRMEFGKGIINSQEYESFKPIDRSGYKEFGTKDDTVEKRIENNLKSPFAPLIRAHVGPYSSTKDRLDSVKEFISWAKHLADTPN